MSEYKIPIVLSSSTNADALNKSSDGSTFSVNFDYPIVIPEDAYNCYITVQESIIWWTVPNITTGVNDAFKLTYFDGTISADYTITIPQGLYNITDLNEAVNRELINDGLPIDNPITIYGDNSTQKSIIQLNIVSPETVSIDFTINNSIRTILGFDSQVIAAQSGPLSIFSDSIAKFNSIDYFLIHCDLADLGLRVNNTYTSTISQVSIDVNPGSQIINRQVNPPEIPTQSLIGSQIKDIRVWLTDQSNNLVDTNGEDYSIRLVIHYSIRDIQNHELKQLV